MYGKNNKQSEAEEMGYGANKSGDNLISGFLEILAGYLTDQLMKIQVVNDVNKDFVIEALRSIAELITYGDQHDANFFECGHGGICTYIKGQQECDRLCPVATNNEHHDTEPEK
nr:protein transparent testa 9 isoform X2 [Tanacetum cinerariifolium]